MSRVDIRKYKLEELQFRDDRNKLLGIFEDKSASEDSRYRLIIIYKSEQGETLDFRVGITGSIVILIGSDLDIIPRKKKKIRIKSLEELCSQLHFTTYPTYIEDDNFIIHYAEMGKEIDPSTRSTLFLVNYCKEIEE